MRKLLHKLCKTLHKLREPADDAEAVSRLKQITPFLAVLLLVIAGIWVVWTVPHHVVQHRIDTQQAGTQQTEAQHPISLDKQLELEDAFRKTLSQIVLSLFGLLILYFTWRRARAGDATVRIMEQGHITDRFTKAIEQLGKTDGATPNIEVRLGAIYALERIALDSPRDHWTIMEILTAYVRQNAPLRPDTPYVEGEKPRTDIQAILTVLGRRRTGTHRERPTQYLDLGRCHLDGAYMFEAHLQGALLFESSLRGATFRKANLQDADLRRANLLRAWLVETNLQGASLLETNLERASLYKANLERVVLRQANLVQANLLLTNLRSADLSDANLHGADLRQATLQKSFLIGADLSSTNLRFANLKDADLHGTNLQLADVSRTAFQGAKALRVEQVKAALFWNFSHYSPAFCAELGLPPEPTEDEDPAPTS